MLGKECFGFGGSWWQTLKLVAVLQKRFVKLDC